MNRKRDFLPLTNNFFWIASDEYIGEASRSAGYVREIYPDAHLVLFSTKHEKRPIFDRVVVMENIGTDLWYLQSTHCFSSDVSKYFYDEKAIYLDTDTCMVDSVDDLFEIMDSFDLAFAHAPGRETQKTVAKIPDCFVEPNIGVEAINFNKRTREFLDLWFLSYANHKDVYKDNDQAPLRETLWNRSNYIKFYIVPIEYNFRFNFGGQVRATVKVLHGRGNYERIAATVNKNPWQIRSWRNGELG